VVSWAKACAFAPRCAHADDACVVPDLELAPMGPSHHVRCVHPASRPGGDR
jgi:peptide/nickel transport system ATP-binding protein